MTKRYNSGRVQKLPQSGITTDRYEFLGLEQAEPDLGDPIVGVSSVAAHPFNGSIYDWYIVASDSSGTGKRYWLPKHIVLADGLRTAGSVTIRSNDTVIGFANGVSDLNFKGGITVTAPGSVAGIGNSAVDIEISSVPEAERSEQAGNLEGGNPGSLPYQESANTTIFLPGPGLERQVLSYDTSNTAPIWRNILDLNPIEVEEKLQDQSYYLSYLVSTGSTSTIGISESLLSFNPSKVRLGVGTDAPQSTLDVRGDFIISGISTFESNSIFKKSVFVQENFDVIGISTFNDEVSIGATLSVSGVSTFSNEVSIGATLSVSGISTFSNNVSISKTDGLFDVASPSVFSGITTINTLTAQSLSPDGIDYGTNLYVPVANDEGSWTWQPVFDAGAGSIDGITVFENGALVGTDIVALDFLNQNYSITISGSAANVSFSENPNFTSVTAGFSSEVTLNSSGINVSGIITATTLDVSSLDVDSSGINVSGFVTTTNLKVTNNATIDNDLIVAGNLTVNGETTTINSVTLTVDDKLISLASTTTPSDAGADGGGIELKGNTDHTILWSNSNDSWDFSENVNITTGNVYRINNASVLSATSLGVGVTNSSLTALGTITTGIWQGSQINDDYIGTINNSNKVSLSALDIDGGTATTSVADADLLIIDDGANGTNRKVTASNLKSYIGSNLAFSGSLSGNLDLNGYDIIGTTGNINITQNIKAGIITATTFVGALTGNVTGTATTATNLNKDVTAGNGLTGGGTLTSNVTLNVGAGTGITINADDVALKNAGSLTNTRILKWDGTQLVNSSITDTGTLVSIGTTIKLGGIQDSTDASGAQYNVPIANGSGGWAWGTIDASSVTGALQNIVEDTTPQLGGNLDLNNKNITGTGNIDINGNIKAGIITATTLVGNLTGTATTATNLNKDVTAGNGLTGGGTLTSNVTLDVGAGTGISVDSTSVGLKNAGSLTSNKVLKWDSGNGQLIDSSITDTGTLVSVGTTIKLGGIQDGSNSSGSSKNVPIANGTGGWAWGTINASDVTGALTDIINDTTPQLGGNLDLNSKNITGTGNIDINGNIKAGIITATTFVGDLIGNVTGTATTSNNVNRDVTAGNGLTGGGTLTSNVTLDVGAGTGISVNSTSVGLKNSDSLTNNKVLKWDDGNGQLIDSSITDTGTLVSVGTTIKLGGIQDSTDASGAQYNVPIANGSGGWSWGTVNASNVTGALTDIINDTTPQLGGNLDLNSKNITGTGNIDINGNIKAGIITATTLVGNLTGTATTATTADNLNKTITAGNGLTGGGTLTSNVTLDVGAGTGISVDSTNVALKNAGSLTSNKVLKWDDGNGQLIDSSITDDGTTVSVGTTIKLGGIQDSTDASGAQYNVPIANGSGGWAWGTVDVGNVSGALADIINDTTPQLGGNLDLNSKNITGTGNIDITGNIKASGIITATTFVGNLTGTATTANNLDRSVLTPADGGLTGGGTLIGQDLNIRLKGYSSLSNDTVLKWTNSTNQLTNSSITDNGTLVGIGTSIKLGYGIFDTNDSTGGTNNVPIANGSGGWAWGSVTSAGGITGVTVSEEGSAISATAFKTLNFVSPNITATDGGGTQANITLTANPTFTNINVTGIVTATTFVGNLTGTATTATNLSRSVLAGSGLIDGGQLTSDVTLNVGAGVGITVNADNIALKNAGSLTTDKVLKWDGTQLVNSSITDNGTTITVTNINATGIVTAATFEVSSDINLKDNVQIIQSPLDKIVKIDGVTFNWKEDNKPSMGVIAQNIEEVIPELVSSGETKHVNYNGLIGLLIESIKELKSEIEELKKNINN